MATALVFVMACGGKSATTSPDDATAGQGAKKKHNAELDDLRALAKQRSYEEMLAKATEVKPTARDEEWESLLETAAIGYLEQLAEATEEGQEMAPVEASKRMVELYPVLAEHDGFRKVRAKTGVDAYSRCWASYCRSHQGWSRDVDWSLAVYEYSKIDPEYSAFIAGKMVMTRLIPETATGMFALAVEHNGKQVCADADLKRSVNEAKREGVWKDEIAQITAVCGS
jgi:hypothetical protein